MFRRDRYLRASDHSRSRNGHTAARFTEPNETLAHEHQTCASRNGRSSATYDFVDFLSPAWSE
jgi:hypothetical protein